MQNLEKHTNYRVDSNSKVFIWYLPLNEGDVVFSVKPQEIMMGILYGGVLALLRAGMEKGPAFQWC